VTASRGAFGVEAVGPRNGKTVGLQHRLNAA
jgi:hypothetical protein